MIPEKEAKIFKTYFETNYKLIDIVDNKKDKEIFVFEKNEHVILVAKIENTDANNKINVGINPLKDMVDLFLSISKQYKNVSSFDFIINSTIIEESRKKFYAYLKEKEIKTFILCGVSKLDEKLRARDF